MSKRKSYFIYYFDVLGVRCHDGGRRSRSSAGREAPGGDGWRKAKDRASLRAKYSRYDQQENAFIGPSPSLRDQIGTSLFTTHTPEIEPPPPPPTA